MSDDLRSRTIRLAWTKPELRKHLLPLLEGNTRRKQADFLEDMTTNPETGKRVKVKTLKNKPKDTPAYKKYEELLKKQKGDGDKAEEKPSAPRPAGKALISAPAGAPQKAKQSVSGKDELFKQAKETHEKQLDWLNRGKGIDKALGAKVIRGDEGQKMDTLPDGPVVMIGPLKEAERSAEKVNADYGGDWAKLTDVVRASIAVDTMADIAGVVAALEKSGMKLAQQPKDRFASPTPAGYRDLSLAVQYENGHVGELQIHLKPILEAKKQGHKAYEKVRSMEATLKEEGREEFTPEEKKVVDEANQKMRDLYDEAWKKATT